MTSDGNRRLDRITRAQLRRLLREKGPEAITLAVWRYDDHASAYFDDNVDGTCSGCGAAVYWRPWVPEAVEKRCLRCLQAEAEGAEP